MQRLNQYFQDTPQNESVYPMMKNFNVNSYKNYKNKDYYTWINNSFKNYSFPESYKQNTFQQICDNENYSLKPQQKFAGRIINTFTDNKGILIYHGLGSGKTQTGIVIGEAFKFRNVKGNKIIPGRTDTTVLIVVPAALVEQYYSEIIGHVENGLIKSATGQIIIEGERQFYLNAKVRNAIAQNNKAIHDLREKLKEEKGVSKIREQILQLEQMNRELHDHEKKKVTTVYSIMSHEKFLNRLFTIENNQFIEGEYLQLLGKKNGLLIIDEAHGLVSAIGTSYRKLLMALRYFAEPSFRVVLLTGSPIYDKPFEFGLLMNLLRPRMIFPDGLDAFNEIFIRETQMINKDLFKQMCSGYVSYFKGGNPEAYPYKRLIIMNHPMEPYQYNMYKTAIIKEVNKDKKTEVPGAQDFLIKISTTEKSDDHTTTSVFNNSRLFCNIAFPEIIPNSLTHANVVEMGKEIFENEHPGQPLPSNGELYSIGMKDYVKKNPAGKKTRSQIIEQGFNEFRTQIRKSNNVLKTVKGYSSKFAKVVEIINESPGPVFVYSNYVWYGVDAIAEVLQGVGYKEYPSHGPLGSYFIWKGQADPQNVKRAYKAFNGIKNKDGSVLKIMLGTQSVMEGVDFKRVRQVHIIDPWWNDSRMQQVMARAIRLCSHRELPESQQMVDVFVHLSSLGSGAKLYELNIREASTGHVKKVYSLLEPINVTDDSSRWIFKEAYINGENVYQSSKQFKVSQIIKDTIKQMADPELSKSIGKWKQLDTISVDQYMYKRALSKLDINRQFEMSIKESALDCGLNTNGNIIRLEEHFIPDGNFYKKQFVNYSTGAIYKSQQETFYTFEQVLAMGKNTETQFVNGFNQIVQFPKSLVVSENINCEVKEYQFDGKIPQSIIDLTLNKEMITFLKKVNLQQIRQFLFDVEHGNVQVSDPQLKQKIKKFYSQESMNEKQAIIQKLKIVGLDEEIWDLYTTEQLKKIYSQIFKI